MMLLALPATLLFIHGILAADRGQINSGETHIGLNISAPSYMDTWTFEGNVGDRIIITAVPTSGTLDTYISLYPPDGGPVEASTPFDKLDCQLQKSGLYTIVIEDIGLNDAGTYNITFLKMPGSVSYPDDLDGGPIASGQTLSGSVNVASDLDAFQFYGDAGDRVVITAVPTSGTLDTYISLYPPDGGPVEASTPFDKLDHQLQKSGLYTIVIEDIGLNDTGTYNITFLKMPGSVSYPDDLDGGPIASGQTLSGTINVASDLDAFQFYGDVSNRVIITAVPTSGTLDTYISLYPPDGGPVEASTPFDKLDHQLQKSGLYTIVIEDGGLNDTGTYNISMTKIPSTVIPGLYNPCPSLGGLISGYCSELQWDAVAGATGYDVYFGLDVVQSLNKIANNISVSSLAMPAIANDKIYYWYVVAHTSTGDIFGPWWWFATFATDFYPDNTVNFIDYAVLAQYWLQNNPSVDIAPPGGDGVIDYLDVAVLVKQWLMTGEVCD
jgi:hypothetical protein